MNQWLTHVQKFHAKHPGLSYKEAMQEARKTYNPVGSSKVAPVPVPVTPAKKPVGRPKKQAGKGVYAAEAQAAAAVVGVAGDVSKSAISAVQTDKANSGRYSKAQFDKFTREFNRLKVKMSKGKWPQMGDKELLAYVEANY